MNVRIYQINMKRDANNVAFMRYELLEKLQGSQAVNAKIYDKVFDGEVDCQTLEDVYQMFNLNHPEGYKDRSLSVSDVVEVMEEDGVMSAERVAELSSGPSGHSVFLSSGPDEVLKRMVSRL